MPLGHSMMRPRPTPSHSSIKGCIRSSAQRYFHEEAARGQQFPVVDHVHGRAKQPLRHASIRTRRGALLGPVHIGVRSVRVLQSGGELGGSSIVSQSPGRGGSWSFDLPWTLSRKAFRRDCSGCRLVLRGSLSVPEWLVDLSGHPEPVHQHRELSGDRDLCPLLRVLATSTRQL